jgi:hypothetical protein
MNMIVSLIHDAVEPDNTFIHWGAHIFCSTPYYVRNASNDAHSSCPIRVFEFPDTITSYRYFIPCVVNIFGIPAPTFEADACMTDLG